jgi:hypothetical protein
MTRAWRQQAGTLLIVFMALAAAIAVCEAVSSVGQPYPRILVGLVLWSFLAWRIWRHHSSRARDTLLVFSALGMLVLVRAVFRWSPDLLGASGLFTAQFVLLLSPAIRHHVRAKPSRSRPSDDQLPSVEPY